MYIYIYVNKDLICKYVYKVMSVNKETLCKYYFFILI